MGGSYECDFELSGQISFTGMVIFEGGVDFSFVLFKDVDFLVDMFML